MESQSERTGRQALAQWIDETKDFRTMVWAAARSFKHACGGHWSLEDKESYEDEAATVTRALGLLEALQVPETATLEEARALALRAIDRRLSEPAATWVPAVLRGDSEGHRTPHHPKNWSRGK